MSKGFSKKVIRIRTETGETDVEAQCRGGLAYHKTIGNRSRWTVTHVASGMTLNLAREAGFESAEEAQEFLTYALTLSLDWTSDFDWRKWWPKKPPIQELAGLHKGWTENRNRKKAEAASNPILELFGVKDP